MNRRVFVSGVLMVFFSANALWAAQKDLVQSQEVWRLDEAQWQSKMESIRQKTDALMQRYRLLLKDYRLLQQRLEQYRQDVLLLKHKIEQLRQRKDALVKEIEDIKKTNESRRKEKDKLEAQRLKTQQRLTRWEAALKQLDDWQAQMETDLLRIQQARLKASLMPQQHHSLNTTSTKSSKTDEEDALFEHWAEVDAVLAQWTMEEAALQQEIEDLQMSCDQLVLKIKQYEAEQKDLKARLAARDKETENQIKEWEAKIAMKQQEVDRWRKEVEALMQKMDQLQQRMAAASEALHHKQALMDDIARLDEENRRLRRELAEWEHPQPSAEPVSGRAP